MNVLYLTMSNINDINESGIYASLIRKFHREGHKLFLVSPSERREGFPTRLIDSNGVKILKVRTLNVQKTNVIEKGIGQLSLEYLYQQAIKKYFGGVKFDLILYSTPPITFSSVIKWVKKENPKAKTYLMLKDIFPQNAIDLGMLTQTGVKGILYRSFRKKEKLMYNISDHIGCMSPANVEYVIRNNPEVDPNKVEICPNSYEIPIEMNTNIMDREAIRKKHNLPLDKTIFIYGGNLGKPQGIPFLIDCLDANKDREDCHFLVVGNGVDYPKLEKWYNEIQPKSVSLFQRLPTKDYEQLADACDVGMIFLDYRFTIPNYPSRLLSYLVGKKPIIACTDSNCDTGLIAEKNGYGMYCESNNVEAFTCTVNKMLKKNLQEMGECGYQFFLNNYTVENTYNIIISHFD